MCTAAFSIQSRISPCKRIRPFGMQQQCFQGADRRQPQLVVLIPQFLLYTPRGPLRLCHAPKPNVRIKQEFQFCNASICTVSITDESISPVISMLPDIEPIQLCCEIFGDAGTTSAITSPRRVTRSGIFVLPTCSTNDRHFALNSEIAIVRNGFVSRLASILLLTN